MLWSMMEILIFLTASSWSQVGLRKHYYKVSGGDGIPAELFQILEDAAANVLHSTCQQIWKTQQWPPAWKRSVFISIPKKSNDIECSNHIQLHSFHVLPRLCSNSVKLAFSSNMNQDHWDVHAGFQIGRGTRDQNANICWVMEKAREFKKNIYFCFIDYAKAFDCGSQQTVANS